MTKLHTIDEVSDALDPGRLEQIEMHILDDDLLGEHFTEAFKPLFEARAELWARREAQSQNAEIATMAHLWGYDKMMRTHWKRTTFVMLKPRTPNIIGKDEDGDYIAIPLNY